MIIVSDTTPLNYLVLIDEVEILERLFGRVFIPPAVFAEFHNEGTPDKVREWADSNPSWLEVKSASDSFIRQVKNLGAGEREAIALALELNAQALLIDERKGTKEARQKSIPVLGTLAILEKAAENGLLDFTSALHSLQQTNYRFPPTEVMQQLIDRDKLRKEQKPK